jgi:PAS domain S-box-containing protein
MIAEMRKGASPFVIEKRYLRPDNSFVWVRSSISFAYNADGNPLFGLGTMEDITESKLAQEKISKSEEHLRIALQGAKAGAWTIDVLTRTAKWTDEMFDIYAIPHGEVPTLEEWAKNIHPDFREQLRQQFTRNFSAKKSDIIPQFTSEFVYINPGGEERWIYNQGNIFYDDEDNPTAVAGVVFDITERKRTEAEIKALSDYNREVLESISDPFFTLDREYRFTYMSSQGEKLVFHQPGELLGKSIWDEFPGLIASPFEKIYREAMDDKIVGTITDFFPDHDRWYEVTAYPSPNGLTVYFRNITENKRREMNLTFLADLQTDFAPIATESEIIKLASSRIAEFLGLSHCLFVENNETADKAIVIYDHHAPDLPSLVGEYDRSEFYSVAELEQIADGKTIVINDVGDKLRPAKLIERFAEFHIGSLITAPYMSDGKAKFVLNAQHTEPHQWRTDEIELLQELAERVWTRIERARTEESLRRSEEEFRQLADAVPQIVWTLAADGTMQYVNEQWIEYSGLDLEATRIRENVGEIIHPDDRESISTIWAKAFAEGTEYEIEGRLQNHLSGEYRWFLMRSKPTKDIAGNVVQWFGTSTDITANKIAALQLRDSEERFRTLFNSIDEGFCIIEIIFDANDKPLDYRFVQANPAFEGLTGLENALGKTVRELVPDLEEFWFEIYGRVALTGESIRFENEAEPMNRWFDIHASRVGDSSSRRVAVVFNDITQRKHAEIEREQMLQRETELRREAEAVNVAKDEFLAMLSHELRSPLNAMLGWTQILEAKDFDRAVTKQAIEVIARNVRLQNALIEDLLDVSRIISGKMRLENEMISLVLIVQTSLDAAQPTALQRSIEISSKLDVKADELFGDKHRLQQIVGNLMTNALKFTPEGGKISVTLKRAGNFAKLTVKDSGIGIPPELLPHIFDRFRQADASSKRQFGGLGLGLTIVKHLVELHGGSISAHSKGKGKGAEFTVKLPLAVRVVSHSDLQNFGKIEAVELKPFAGVKILVVDDEDDALKLMSFILREKGADIDCVNSAAAALNKLQTDQYDLLISDLGMAGMDGLDLIRQLREIEKDRDKNLPAIALTGYVSTDDRERVIQAGFQTHLPKPVNIEQLSTVAMSLIQRNSQTVGD